MGEPLQPSNALVIKLGSALVHAEEFIETGEPRDKGALDGLLSDPEVVAWREQMDALALLPKKRAS